MTTHPPTPWEAKQFVGDPRRYYITDSHGYSVAGLDGDNQEAKAAFIVLAVNSIDALLAAAEDTLALLAEDGVFDDDERRVYTNLQAAIAAAKGRTA